MITIEEMLIETGRDRMQTAGQMQIIPILGENDVLFASLDGVAADVVEQGKIRVHNANNRHVILPHGIGWESILSTGAILSPKSTRDLPTTPGEVRRSPTTLHMLPAEIRAKTIGMLPEHSHKIWKFIEQFNYNHGIKRATKSLDPYEEQFGHELNQFVAEFELVPNQVGAVILIAGRLAGVEMAPSTNYWATMWKPLIRDCYGSLAIRAAQKFGKVTGSRVNLAPLKEKTIRGVAEQLQKTKDNEEELVEKIVKKVLQGELNITQESDRSGFMKLSNVSNERLAGQIVTVTGKHASKKVRFASLCISG